jgi:hypothetical protein
VALGSHIADTDDLTLKIRLYLATALAERGNDQAALAVYDEALRSERRSGELLTAALYGRACTYLRLGNRD